MKESEGIERIALFSDAVFAISITLLSLDLMIPQDLPEAEVSTKLRELWPGYEAFAFTFLLIGLRWLTHHVQFRFIKYYDDTLLGVNLALLAVVAFLPFASRVLADYPDSRSANALYLGSMAFAGLVSTLLWVHACWIGHLIEDQRLTTAARLNLLGRWITLPILFGIALIFIFTFASLWPARVVALVTPIVQIVIATRFRPKSLQV